MVFFAILLRKFEKAHVVTGFHLRSPIPRNQDRLQSPWFSKLYKDFLGYILA